MRWIFLGWWVSGCVFEPTLGLGLDAAQVVDENDGSATRGNLDASTPASEIDASMPAAEIDASPPIVIDAAVDNCVDVDGDGFGVFGRAACPNTGEDCDDANADVFPGQVDYFARSAGLLGWDYDCSGQEEMEYSAIGHHGKRACTPGWKESVPACGSVAKWMICIGKEKEEINRTQRCH